MPNKRSRAPQSFQKEGRASPTRGCPLGPEICTVGNPGRQSALWLWRMGEALQESRARSDKEQGQRRRQQQHPLSVEATLSGMRGDGTRLLCPLDPGGPIHFRG